jgi:hypothetical protein
MNGPAATSASRIRVRTCSEFVIRLSLNGPAALTAARAWLVGVDRLARPGPDRRDLLGHRVARGDPYRRCRMAAAVWIWDAATGASSAELTGHTGYLSKVAWSPDGYRLATASLDGTARIRDAATGRSSAVLTGHTPTTPAPDPRDVVDPAGPVPAPANEYGSGTEPGHQAGQSGHHGPVRAGRVPDGDILAWLREQTGTTGKVPGRRKVIDKWALGRPRADRLRRQHRPRRGHAQRHRRVRGMTCRQVECGGHAVALGGASHRFPGRAGSGLRPPEDTSPPSRQNPRDRGLWQETLEPGDVGVRSGLMPHARISTVVTFAGADLIGASLSGATSCRSRLPGPVPARRGPHRSDVAADRRSRPVLA